MDSIGYNINAMQKNGCKFVTSFTLPGTCWTDHYFIPRGATQKALSDKYVGNKTVEAFLKENQYEGELYSKYKQYYGYAFYIGEKVQ